MPVCRELGKSYSEPQDPDIKRKFEAIHPSPMSLAGAKEILKAIAKTMPAAVPQPQPRIRRNGLYDAVDQLLQTGQLVNSGQPEWAGKVDGARIEDLLNQISEDATLVHSDAEHEPLIDSRRAENSTEKLYWDGGTFGIASKGGPLTYQWNKALEIDAELKASYALQKGRQQRAEFRKKWAMGVWKRMKTEREHLETVTEKEWKDGSYEPITVIFQKEGGDGGALKATRNYIAACLALGGPWIQFNDMTRRF